MSENKLTYTLDLVDMLSPKLKQIAITTDEQLETWAKVEKSMQDTKKLVNNLSPSIGTLKAQINALKEQKEWIPAANKAQLIATDKAIEKLEKDLAKLENTGQKATINFGTMFSGLGTSALIGIKNGISSLLSGISEAQEIQATAEAKLNVTMHNAMNATEEQIQSIKDLASEQQNIGVIGDEVQLGGAQEMATYLEDVNSLKTLMPVMNDMLAQQYGLNATQEAAVQIGGMLGKVMQGQVGALSRYGYSFDETQEKILKFGTEQEKVAVLADVVSASVNGVNQALAETPEGKLQQAKNRFGDIQETLGKLMNRIKSALLPITNVLYTKIEQAISFTEKHLDDIIGFVEGLANSILGVTDWIAKYSDDILFFAECIGAVVVAYKLWQGAQLLLNTIMAANPISLIVIGVVALAAAIGYVIYKVNGWSDAWDGLCTFLLAKWEIFKSNWLIGIESILQGFNRTVDGIKRQWYELQKTLGIGNKRKIDVQLEILDDLENERKKAMARLTNQKEDEQRKAEYGWTKMTNSLTWGDDQEESKNKKNNGVFAALTQAVNGFGSTPNVGTTEAQTKKGTEQVVTGGTKNTTINITLNKFFENIVYEQGGVAENAEDTESKFAEMLKRVLYAAQTAV